MDPEQAVELPRGEGRPRPDFVGRQRMIGITKRLGQSAIALVQFGEFRPREVVCFLGFSLSEDVAVFGLSRDVATGLVGPSVA
ncbi:hypothetical protein AB7C87_01400 [Natrarchaeobius sp. A-rgal3]|uniref:hypothetical protein n=1 Tax=Natrarchaeobius versutus TaxID=1679078 RepID=UPI0035108C47